LDDVPPDLRSNILVFYAGGAARNRSHQEQKAWQKTAQELQALQAGPHSTAAADIRKRILVPLFKLHSPKGKDTGF